MSQVAIEGHEELEASISQLFPLPLSPVERLMFEDTNEHQTMMCDVELQFQGCIKRDAFDAALEFALLRAPIYRSLIKRNPKGRYVWVLSDLKPLVHWAPFGTPCHDEHYDEYVDLSKALGFRVYVREGNDRSTVRFHSNHAYADAIGTCAFVEDFLTGYANATPGTEPVTPRRLEPERLLNRCSSVLEFSGFRRALYDLYCGIRESIRFFAQRPLHLGSQLPALEKDREPRQTTCLSQVCNEELTVALRYRASDSGVAVNDILIRDLFVTLQDWLVEHGATGNRNIRILMPQNLRGRGDNRMPTTNDMGFAFVTRKASKCVSTDELLQSIASETAAIRVGKLSRYFIGGLDVIQRIGAIRMLLEGPFCFSTAVLTNLGKSWNRFEAKFPRTKGGLVVGNLVYDGFLGLPPLRRKTSVAISVTTTPTEIWLGIRSDPHLFSIDESEEFLKRYVQKLSETAGLNS